MLQKLKSNRSLHTWLRLYCPSLRPHWFSPPGPHLPLKMYLHLRGRNGTTRQWNWENYSYLCILTSELYCTKQAMKNYSTWNKFKWVLLVIHLTWKKKVAFSHNLWQSSKLIHLFDCLITRKTKKIINIQAVPSTLPFRVLPLWYLLQPTHATNDLR